MHRRSLLLLAAHPLFGGASPIQGRWRSVTATRGGIGAVYDFHSNGSATYSTAAIVETDYRHDRNILTLGGQPIGTGWLPDGRLQLNYGNDEVEDFTRQGRAPDAAKPLVGEWIGSRMMEGRRLPVTLQLHDNHRALLVITLKALTGRYQRSAPPDAAWMLTLPSLPPRKIIYDPGTGQLSITASGGGSHLFARF